MSTDETHDGPSRAYLGPEEREARHEVARFLAERDGEHGDPYSPADLGQIDPETATDEERAEALPDHIGGRVVTWARVPGRYVVERDMTDDLDGRVLYLVPEGEEDTSSLARHRSARPEDVRLPDGEKPVRVLDAPGTVEAVRAVAEAVATNRIVTVGPDGTVTQDEVHFFGADAESRERAALLAGLTPQTSPASPVAVATDAAMLHRLADALDQGWPLRAPWNGYLPLTSARADLDDVAAWLRATVGAGEGPRVLAVLTPEEHEVLSRGVDRELDDLLAVARDAETDGDEAVQGLALRERDRAQRLAYLLDLPGGSAPAG